MALVFHNGLSSKRSVVVVAAHSASSTPSHKSVDFNMDLKRKNAGCCYTNIPLFWCPEYRNFQKIFNIKKKNNPAAESNSHPDKSPYWLSTSKGVRSTSKYELYSVVSV